MSRFMRTALDPSEQRIIRRTLIASILFFVGVFAWSYGPVTWAYWSYKPQEGDIFFQSLPKSMLAKMMEGVSESQYSHCGIVAKRDGEWVIYESHQKVRATSLIEAIFRGNRFGFAIYRLKPEHQNHIQPMLDYVQQQSDKLYDVRFQMDDDELYSSELIYKAYRQATGGDSLGKLTPLGQLRWKPFKEIIRFFEQGPVPLRRPWITPKSLAQDEKLDLIFVHRIEINQPYVAPTQTNNSSASDKKNSPRDNSPVIIN